MNRSEAAQWKRAEEMLREEGAEPSRATIVAVIGARWRAGRLADAQAALAPITGDFDTINTAINNLLGN